MWRHWLDILGDCEYVIVHLHAVLTLQRTSIHPYRCNFTHPDLKTTGWAGIRLNGIGKLGMSIVRFVF